MSDDVDQIMAVMDVAFAPEFGEAWSRRQVEDALLLGNCAYGLIATNGAAPAAGDAAAGFFLARHVAGEEELLLIAVAPAARRGGLGALLLERFVAAATDRGARRLLLEMRDGNPAEALYRRYGFLPVGRRRDYYRTRDGRRLDAITCARQLDE